jgi:hypothetical protein
LLDVHYVVQAYRLKDGSNGVVSAGVDRTNA